MQANYAADVECGGHQAQEQAEKKTLGYSKSKVWVDLATACRQKKGGLTDEVHAILPSSWLNDMLWLYRQQLVMIKKKDI